jgi:diguanylate cyclase (GGDEF)-like protein
MSAPPIRVVVVDDEPVVRQYLDVVLQDMGCKVELFSTCAAGLERCKVVDFDVILVDKNLPDGSGMAICRALVGKDCRVALITGYANLSSAVEAMRYGVAEYFIKPLDIEDLEARLLRMTEHLSLERQNRALVAELQEKNRALEQIAARDPVTGLYNHTHFQDRIRGEVARCKGRHSFSVALLALDRFSEVNQKVGHVRGDLVLKRVGEMLSTKNELEHSDLVLGEQDLVCRIEGDVFAVLMPDVTRSVAARKFQFFRSLIKRSKLAEELHLQTASIGIAQYPDDGDTAERLLRAAGRALDAAKKSGGDTLIWYRAEHHKSEADGVVGELKLIHALGRSLTNRMFRFDYQPIVDTADWCTTAYEALCRPTDETFANVGELLEVTSRAGRLTELGDILREIAVKPVALLPRGLRLFLTIHPQDLNDGGLFEADSALDPIAQRIVLEITETEAITDFMHARERLGELRKRGYGIALDDLGSGYSGLNSLALLEPDFVKLDMALVRNIEPGSRAARLARHIREFCDAEHIQTIAEGVETTRELSVLQDVGIRHMQGYLFARPREGFRSIIPRP